MAMFDPSQAVGIDCDDEVLEGFVGMRVGDTFGAPLGAPADEVDEVPVLVGGAIDEGEKVGAEVPVAPGTIFSPAWLFGPPRVMKAVVPTMATPAAASAIDPAVRLFRRC
ncbi:hypothetical protein [Catenulispora sp. GAS73]|uniref:hypothetical protein n=1 Tax=Catenulispora sp. GAS73 TaxID=3156269 RepID=UPI00351640D0